MIRIASLDDAGGPAYDAFVDAHPRGSVFHTRVWVENVCRALHAEAHTLVAWRGRDVAGVLPLVRLVSPLRGVRLLSVPYCRYLPPLADGPAAEGELVDAAVALGRRLACRFVELRTGPLATLPDGAEAQRFFDTWCVDLTSGEDACWHHLHARGTRRAVRFAERSGVSVREVSTPEGYRILARLDRITRRRQGVPSHPRELVLGLGERFEPIGRALLLLAIRDGEPIAAELALRHGTTWHGILGVDAGPASRGTRASTLLLWEAMRHAIRGGATRFDLGPAHRANLGLTAFKRRFGAVASPADTVTIALTGQAPDEAVLDRPWIRLARGTLRRLPPPLHDAVSPLLAREVA